MMSPMIRRGLKVAGIFAGLFFVGAMIVDIADSFKNNNTAIANNAQPTAQEDSLARAVDDTSTGYVDRIVRMIPPQAEVSLEENIPTAKLISVQDDIVSFYNPDDRQSSYRGTRLIKHCSFQVGTEIREYLMPSGKALIPMRMYELDVEKLEKPEEYTAIMFVQRFLHEDYSSRDKRVIDKNLDGIILDYKLLEGPK